MAKGQSVSRRDGKSSRAAIGRAALIASVSGAIVTVPLGVTWRGFYPDIAWQVAAAKDGKGRGGGNADGGGSGKGKDKGNSNSKGGAAASRGAAAGQRRDNPAAARGFKLEGAIEVVHRNGMRERIRAGRYLMKDGKGRTIIERAATAADLRRLSELDR